MSLLSFLVDFFFYAAMLSAVLGGFGAIHCSHFLNLSQHRFLPCGQLDSALERRLICERATEWHCHCADTLATRLSFSSSSFHLSLAHM